MSTYCNYVEVVIVKRAYSICHKWARPLVWVFEWFGSRAVDISCQGKWYGTVLLTARLLIGQLVLRFPRLLVHQRRRVQGHGSHVDLGRHRLAFLTQLR